MHASPPSPTATVHTLVGDMVDVAPAAPPLAKSLSHRSQLPEDRAALEAPPDVIWVDWDGPGCARLLRSSLDATSGRNPSARGRRGQPPLTFRLVCLQRSCQSAELEQATKSTYRAIRASAGP